MAGNTVSMSLQIDGVESLAELTKFANGLKKAMNGVVVEVQQLKGNVINFAALATGLDAAQRSFNQLQGVMQNLSNYYAVQETNERKLETVMRQRMGATDEEIQSIKDLASAQQKIGVVGDEVQLAGAQQIATFLNEKSSIDTLLPAMNDLLVQQKGLNATTGDAAGVANLMGKAMQGQVSALTRVGITLTEAQSQVMKFGTESERAAMLAQIITDNVGHMNREMGETDSGRQQQMANAIGDIKEQIGGLVNGALPFVTIAAQSTTALTSVITLCAGVKTLVKTMWSSVKIFTLSAAAYVKNKGAALALASAQKAAAWASTAWVAIQKALNVVLSANPIGIVIAAVGALAAGIIYAYRHCETFREIVNKVWSAIKPLAEAIVAGLVKAFDWLVEKCKAAWGWLKKIFGFSGKKIEVDVEVNKPDDDPDGYLAGLEKKYAGYKVEKEKSTPAKSSKTGNTPVWTENAKTLKEYTDNIKILDDKLQTATIEEAALLNQQRAAFEKEAEAIRNVGLEAENTGAVLHDYPQNLKEIGESIAYWREKLQTATLDEATAINQKIAALEKEEEAFRKAGEEADKTGAILHEYPQNLKEIGESIAYWREQLQTATIEQAAVINQNITALQKLEDEYRNAGAEAKSAFDTMREGYNNIKGIGSGVEALTDIIKGNGNAWQKLTGAIDGFLQIYEGIAAISEIIKALTTASELHASAKMAEAAAIGATEAAQVAETATAETAAVAQTPVIAANKAAASSYMKLAAAAYFAAHAYIPLWGFEIAAGFVSASKAAVEAIGAIPFANGGIISGPTLGLMGEYAGAVNNPEVVAPLSDLEHMLRPADSTGGKVVFEIEGRKLVGVLAKETNHKNRS